MFRSFSRACALVAALAVAGCGAAPSGVLSSSPAAPQVSASRDPGDARIGAEAHKQILAQFGGEYTEGGAARYVRDLGMRLAAASEQPNEGWTFTLLDSPVVNAFALPGGYVYVTRGLMALADDEAELAGVIGHEIGHVTAGHSARRRTQSTLAQIGVFAAVLAGAAVGLDGGALDMIGQGASALGQGAVASFSRDQELEADTLGVRYLARAGFDPEAQSEFLASMQAQAELSAKLAGARYDPTRVDFFATHPADAERVRLAAQAARAAGATDAERGRERYLRVLDGMVYGDSPRQGFVRGQRFVHPGLRFRFDAADGFTIANSARAVAMRGPNGSRTVFDAVADPGGEARDYLVRGWGAELNRNGVGALQQVESLTIGGRKAARALAPARTRSGAVALSLTVIEGGDGRFYRFLGVSDPRDRASLAAQEATAESFRKLSAAEARRARPWRLDVLRVRAGDTAASLGARMPFDDAAAERFRVLNSLAPGEEPRVGDQVKIIVE